MRRKRIAITRLHLVRFSIKCYVNSQQNQRFGKKASPIEGSSPEYAHVAAIRPCWFMSGYYARAVGRRDRADDQRRRRVGKREEDPPGAAGTTVTYGTRRVECFAALRARVSMPSLLQDPFKPCRTLTRPHASCISPRALRSAFQPVSRRIDGTAIRVISRIRISRLLVQSNEVPPREKRTRTNTRDAARAQRERERALFISRSGT